MVQATNRRIFGIASLLVLIWLPVSVRVAALDTPHSPPAYGHIDLSSWNFARKGVATLDGRWTIYWRRLLEPRDIDSAKPDGWFRMPGTWNAFRQDGRPVGGIGFATFAVKVLLPKGMRHAALRIPDASTAYKLWANGSLVAQSGHPGSSKQTTTPHYSIQTAQVATPDSVLSIVLQVSNFDHRRGGMWKPIEIGTHAQIEANDAVHSTYDLLLLGSFLAMAVYNLLLYLGGNRRNRAPLFLSLLFLVLCLRISVMGEMIVTRIFPGFPWSLQLRIEYLTAIFALLTLVLAIRETYRKHIPNWFTASVWTLVLINVSIVIAAPVLFYSRIVFLFVYGMLLSLGYIVVRFVLLAIRGDRGVLAGIAAAAITFFIAFGDLAHFSQWVTSRDFAPFGFLISLLARSSENQPTVYFASAAINLVFIFAAANLIILKGTRSLVAVSNRALVEMNGEQGSPGSGEPLSKYSRSGLSEGEIERLYRRLVDHLHTSRSFLDPAISLETLARELHVTRHYISQVVNSKTSGNFYSFVNRFRIAEFKTRVDRGEHRGQTLAALAEACGFTSYATFFSAFKREMKTTPRAYIAAIDPQPPC